MRVTRAMRACALLLLACGSPAGDEGGAAGGSGGAGGTGIATSGGAAAGPEDPQAGVTGGGAGGASAGASGAQSAGAGAGAGGASTPPDDAGASASSDAGTSDAGVDPPVVPQNLPQPLRDAGAVALFPAPNASATCVDPPLSIVFSGPPSFGNTGTIEVFDVAQPATVVARIDLAASTTTDTIGGTLLTLQRRAHVDGNTAVVYLPGGALEYGHSYFVHVSAGALRGPGNAAVTIADATTWTFNTAPAAPSDVSTLSVALDGSGDFCTVQGAVDATDGDTEIAIARGTYHELIHIAGKSKLTLRGADRKATIIAGVNNEKLNGGTAKRALVGVDASSEVSFERLTIHNLTPQDGSQAEALRMQTCDKCSLRDADVLSLQDTLLWSGRVYAKDSFIAGNVDFIWGTGAAYFDHCEIKTVGRKGYNVQARNGAGGYGYVFVDCKLTSDPGITGNWLARVATNTYPASHVAYIDCELGSHIDPVGWQVTGGGTSSLRFWEYQSRTPSGAMVDVSQRLPGSEQLTSQEAATMRDPSVVLGGWTPP